jgi:hypothetical protein
MYRTWSCSVLHYTAVYCTALQNSHLARWVVWCVHQDKLSLFSEGSPQLVFRYRPVGRLQLHWNKLRTDLHYNMGGEGGEWTQGSWNHNTFGTPAHMQGSCSCSCTGTSLAPTCTTTAYIETGGGGGRELQIAKGFPHMQGCVCIKVRNGAKFIHCDSNVT